MFLKQERKIVDHKLSASSWKKKVRNQDPAHVIVKDKKEVLRYYFFILYVPTSDISDLLIAHYWFQTILNVNYSYS